MIPPGIEIVIGTQCDPTFGPMIVVGMGGVLVEILRDSTAELAPVGKPLAHAMLKRLKGHRLLEGYRGSAAVDIDALANIIVQVSRLAADLADEIVEIDVNTAHLRRRAYRCCGCADRASKFKRLRRVQMAKWLKSQENIIFEVRDRIAWITLNRPQAQCALAGTHQRTCTMRCWRRTTLTVCMSLCSAARARISAPATIWPTAAIRRTRPTLKASIARV
ncbi:MAG: acetate--CoA ligase family protein [Rhizomicrobium sp.]